MLLDPQIETNSSIIANLSLSQVRLHHNAAFPWLLLVPNKTSICEIIDLAPDDRQMLMQEISFVSQVVKEIFHPDKINIAALGNVVPQLHIHIIARYKTDLAWPNPVWNTVESIYDSEEKTSLIIKIQEKLCLLEENFI